jgi:4-hydroxy-tetrahydrodipicolinate synthase
MDRDINGVFAASVTPLKEDFSPDLDAIPGLLEFLANRGCHGALMLGTTGEGPSFSVDERISIYGSVREFKQNHPRFRLLAGTGTPSLTETIHLTRQAFAFGFDGVVVLPPYYYHKVDEQGLFAWFSQVIRKAVPEGGILLGYHIPPVTGMGFSLHMLEKLRKAFPDQFAGIKDSSSNMEFARLLGKHFGKDLLVMNGNDRLFTQALEQKASGCITALANLYSPELRRIWDEYHKNGDPAPTQERVKTLRSILEANAPFPAIIKSMLSRQHNFPFWTVRPPLMPANKEVIEEVFRDFSMAVRVD